MVNQVNGFRNVVGISNLVVNQLAFNTRRDSLTYNVENHVDRKTDSR